MVRERENCWREQFRLAAQRLVRKWSLEKGLDKSGYFSIETQTNNENKPLMYKTVKLLLLDEHYESTRFTCADL